MGRRRRSSWWARNPTNRSSRRSTAVELLVGPSECAYVEDAEVDTAIPTALARAALEHAPGRRGVVVQGRYAHVSFIIDPAPLRVTVREVVPPYPAKLFDQTRRLLDVAEHLPPIELVADVVELDALAAETPSTSYLSAVPRWWSVRRRCRSRPISTNDPSTGTGP